MLVTIISQLTGSARPVGGGGGDHLVDHVFEEVVVLSGDSVSLLQCGI